MMRSLLISLIVICISGYANLSAQEKIAKSDSRLDEDGVYFVAEKMPEFPGGQTAMMKYLAEHIKYPEEAQKLGYSGRVIVCFTVDETGKLKDIKVARKEQPSLDAEAVRVVTAMPQWIPGEDKGKKVSVRFTVPIMFRLTGKDTASVPNKSPNFKPLVLHKLEDGVKNKSLVGIWQICKATKDSLDNYLVFSGIGLKIISPDKTFKNISMSAGPTNSSIIMQGNYEIPSDSMYVEFFTYSFTPIFPVGTWNEIHVEFLHDNLIQLSFTYPGQKIPTKEYWVRVVALESKSLQ